jgi:hypothetical protein
MARNPRPKRLKSETEISYLALRKRYSSLIALERKQLKRKNLTTPEKKDIETNISSLVKKREEVNKQISLLSKVILAKQVEQLASLDTSKLSIITKTETNKALVADLFQDGLDEFIVSLNKL